MLCAWNEGTKSVNKNYICVVKKGIKQISKTEWKIAINMAKGVRLLSQEGGSCVE